MTTATETNPGTYAYCGECGRFHDFGQHEARSPVPGMSDEAWQAWTDKLYPPQPTTADLAAFADAVQDYAMTYAAEEQGSEADKSWRRQSLLLEGAELFRRAGLTA